MGNAQLSISEEDNKWFLILSNLSYLLPAGVTFYQMYKKRGSKMDKFDGWSLIVLFLFITFFSSWSYHQCRGDVVIDEGIDPEQLSPNLSEEALCTECPSTTMNWTSGSDDLTLHLTKFIDHFLAMFTIFMVIIYVIPISEKFRKFFIIMSLVWFVLFLSTGNDMIAALPILFASIVLIMFWALVFKKQDTGGYDRNIAWSLSLISTILAFVFFKWDTEPYWLKHSLWHMLGAFAGAFLLSKMAYCYDGVHTEKLKVPRWMQAIFVTPQECSKYEDILHHRAYT